MAGTIWCERYRLVVVFTVRVVGAGGGNDVLERIVEAHIDMKAWKRRAAEIERQRALL